ncbi:hypothetical protein K437DRAFT_259668 [Tilletiaria anomala UBC 951]|uniref:NAD(+) diphosphatase n=1 Tax=Tilletiaria anomala (strain ATCC 24038 / CBS 436.72 / UBC 951) TaxID=1037660 RepID=A0A066VGM6_TILAU|nr:uncharacterized protein K437DRAFT_259668 [Tilletiaria anomala UBC 951]KDN37740.1 hypothetical protein K437DRAFT_259668 [Tilletiaria anomala UBC 951]
MEQTGFASFTTVNFYSGSKLNRLSWLRTSSEFINAALTSDDSRFVVLNRLNPLVYKGGDRNSLLATLSWKDVKDCILSSVKASGGDPHTTGDAVQVFGPDAYGLKLPEGADEETVKEFKKATDSIGPSTLALVFLGVDESQVPTKSLPGDLAGTKQQPAGTPYFALSLNFTPPSPTGKEWPMAALKKHLEEHPDYDFVDTRALAHAGTWPKSDAAILAHARSLIDWNERHHHCPACSRRQYSLWAGYKRGCSSGLRQAEQSPFITPFLGEHKHFGEDGKGDCPSTRLLSNFSYPRSDPVIIAGILSADGERILLGRQRTWPKSFYSCLAGFVEPGESLEEAVRREIHEEAGVGVGAVVYHSTQSWAFPSQFMIGVLGYAMEGQDSIRLDLDNELEDARWFTRAEVLQVLESSATSSLTKQDVEKFDENTRIHAKEDRKKGEAEGCPRNGDDEKWDSKAADGVVKAGDRHAATQAPFKIPGATAIAHVLIASWARKEAYLPPPPASSSGKGKM